MIKGIAFINSQNSDNQNIKRQPPSSGEDLDPSKTRFITWRNLMEEFSDFTQLKANANSKIT